MGVFKGVLFFDCCGERFLSGYGSGGSVWSCCCSVVEMFFGFSIDFRGGDLRFWY